MAASRKPKPHVVWKGAIAFGLVHIPVTLISAAREHDLDFDWLDKRDMAPIGYQRINKTTGKPVESENIVKGYAFEKGEYVLMSDADFQAANPEATQTIEITSFCKQSEITPTYFVTPYFLQPHKRAEKGYALLRDTLQKSGRVGVATVVIYRKQRLAILYPEGKLLRLNTLRFDDEMLEPAQVELPAEAKAGAGAKEREMAARLVDDMTEPFDPTRYHDTYRDDLLERIEQKVKSGKTHVLATEDHVSAPRKGAQVIDLMDALKRSLREGEPRKRRPAAKATARPRTATKATKARKRV